MGKGGEFVARQVGCTRASGESPALSCASDGMATLVRLRAGVAQLTAPPTAAFKRQQSFSFHLPSPASRTRPLEFRGHIEAERSAQRRALSMSER